MANPTVKNNFVALANGQSNYLNANGNFAIINQLMQARAATRGDNAPPGSPNDEAMYIIGTSPTGAWAGKANQLAYWLSDPGMWTFIVPNTGYRVAVMNEFDANGAPRTYAYTGGAWVLPEGAGALGGAAVVTESGTSRVAALSDNTTYIRFTNASATTFTVPPQSSVAWGSVVEIHIRRASAAVLTLVAGSGVTLNPPANGTLNLTNNMSVTLKRVASDVWDILGQTVPA